MGFNIQENYSEPAEGIVLLNRAEIDLTPDLAAHFLDFNLYSTQRTLRVYHVDELADKMVKGLFRYGNVAFAKLRENGSADVLMDGQHVCHAVVKSGITVPAVKSKYVCDTARDMSKLFQQFEILPRSLSDFVKAEAAAIGLTWPAWVAGIVVSAAVMHVLDQPLFHHTGMSRTSTPGGPNILKRPLKISQIYSKSYLSLSKKVTLLTHYREIGEDINAIYTFDSNSSDRKTVRHIAKVPVAFTMLETFIKEPIAARIFWTQVRDGESLKKDSGPFRLRDFLMQNMIVGVMKPTNHEIISKVHTAWNAYRGGRTTSLRYKLSRPPAKLM